MGPVTTACDYQAALEVLESRRRGPRPTRTASTITTESFNIPRSEGDPDVRGRASLHGMRGWLEQLGHDMTIVNRLNIIHVAGTKGKGSTCASIETQLRVYGKRTGFPKKTGLYTSPHLIKPQERIRINYIPLDENTFARHIFTVHETLQSFADNRHRGPRYLQFLFLVAIHAFIEHRVDVAIIETHQGGEFDATNVISQPVVTAITRIDEDHMHQLGPSLRSVAWHKAGIFKPSAIALSAPQQNTQATMLQERAAEKGVSLQFVDVISQFPSGALQPTTNAQLVNFSLAHAVSQRFLCQKAPGNDEKVLSPPDICQALEIFSWPGRFQKIRDGHLTWYLDGAHNVVSLVECAHWFSQSVAGNGCSRVLIFGHQSSHRDRIALIQCLAKSLQLRSIIIDHVIFTTDISSRSASNESQFLLLDEYMHPWHNVYPRSSISKVSYVGEALDLAKSFGSPENAMLVLITGSLHVVGEALRVFDYSPDTMSL